jgi:hypothetical protein
MPLAAAITKKRAMGFLLECLEDERRHRFGRGGIPSRGRVAIDDGKRPGLGCLFVRRAAIARAHDRA